MPIFTGSPTNSVQYALQNSPSRAAAGDIQGAMRVAPFNYVHAAGSGTGEVNLVILPPGRIRIYSDLSRIVTSDMAVSATLHLGFRAHRQEDGSAVEEDDHALTQALAVGAGARDEAFGLPAVGQLDLESQGGITIFALITSGNIEDGDTIEGWVLYSRP
jgi:hypothetical protein